MSTKKSILMFLAVAAVGMGSVWSAPNDPTSVTAVKAGFTTAQVGFPVTGATITYTVTPGENAAGTPLDVEFKNHEAGEDSLRSGVTNLFVTGKPGGINVKGVKQNDGTVVITVSGTPTTSGAITFAPVVSLSADAFTGTGKPATSVTVTASGPAFATSVAPKPRIAVTQALGLDKFQVGVDVGDWLLAKEGKIVYTVSGAGSASLKSTGSLTPAEKDSLLPSGAPSGPNVSYQTDPGSGTITVTVDGKPDRPSEGSNMTLRKLPLSLFTGGGTNAIDTIHASLGAGIAASALSAKVTDTATVTVTATGLGRLQEGVEVPAGAKLTFAVANGRLPERVSLTHLVASATNAGLPDGLSLGRTLSVNTDEKTAEISITGAPKKNETFNALAFPNGGITVRNMVGTTTAVVKTGDALVKFVDRASDSIAVDPEDATAKSVISIPTLTATYNDMLPSSGLKAGVAVTKQDYVEVIYELTNATFPTLNATELARFAAAIKGLPKGLTATAFRLTDATVRVEITGTPEESAGTLALTLDEDASFTVDSRAPAALTGTTRMKYLIEGSDVEVEDFEDFPTAVAAGAKIIVGQTGLDKLQIGTPIRSGLITYTLENDAFVSGARMTLADFAVSGLPVGVNVAAPRRTDEHTVTVAVTGTPRPTTAGAVNIRYGTNISASNFVDRTGPATLGTNGGIDTTGLGLARRVEPRPAVSITRQPISVTVTAGAAAAELKVEAATTDSVYAQSETDALKYKWYEVVDNDTIPVAEGGEGATLQTPSNLQANDNRTYRVRVSTARRDDGREPADSNWYETPVLSSDATVRVVFASDAIQFALDTLWSVMSGGSRTIEPSWVDGLTELNLIDTLRYTNDRDSVEKVGIRWSLDEGKGANVVVLPKRNATNREEPADTFGVAKIVKPEPDGIEPDYVDVRLARALTVTDAAGVVGGTMSDTITLRVPKKTDVSSLITFAADTVEFVNLETPVRIKPARFGLGSLNVEYRYTYHASANNAGWGSGALGNVMDFTLAGGGDLSHDQAEVGVTDVGSYWVRVSVRDANNSGFAVAPLLVKGAVLTADRVKLADPPEGGYVFRNSAYEPKAIVNDENGDPLTTGFSVVYENNVNAGKGVAKVAGSGARTRISTLDTVAIEFDIAKATLKPRVTVGARQYNATDTITPSRVTVALNGVSGVSQGSLNNGYKITEAKYVPDGQGIAKGRADVTVEVDTATVFGRNHAFENGTNVATISDTTVVISRKTAATSDFKFTIPTGRRLNGEQHPVTVTFNDTNKVGEKVWPISDTSAVVVLYSSSVAGSLHTGYVANTDTTIAPSRPGTYTVKAQVRNGRNLTNDKVTLSSAYTILDRMVPVLNPDLAATALNLRSGVIHTIGVTAKADSADLTYQWFKISGRGFADTTAVDGETDTSFLVPTGTPFDTVKYFVAVTSSHATQSDTTVRSRVLQVNVNAPALDVRDLNIDITGTFEYDGRAKVPTAAQIRVTTMAGATVPAADYRVVVDPTRNLNAGTAIITVIGQNNYGYSTERSFEIAKKPIAASDVGFRPTRTYTGVAQPVEVFATSTGTGNNIVERTGLGAVSAAEYRLVVGTDTGEVFTEAPTNAGRYTVKVKIAEGANFKAADSTFLNLGSYVINKKTPARADFSGYTIPTAAVKLEDAPVDIGTIALPGDSAGYRLIVRYVKGGVASLTSPTDTGTYNVTAEVLAASANYFPSNQITLGTFRIFEETGVASADRVIPVKKDESAVVAPVAVVAGEFSVGPNPVAKASGKVGFFWNGGALKGGTLYVYDASGSLVTKVAVSGAGAIGSWNLVDAKGRPVAEGTYLVKGALVTKAGSKVKVSSIVGVAK